MAEQAEIESLIVQFGEILSETERVVQLNECEKEEWLTAYMRIRTILEEYTNALEHFERIRRDLNSKQTLKHVDLSMIDRLSDNARDRVNNKDLSETYVKVATKTMNAELSGVLFKISTESKKAIAFLGSIRAKISKEQLAQLEPLRKELKEMNIEVTYERNITEALNELESGHFLASSLISSRVIDRCMDAISGKTDDEKIMFLIEKKVVKNDEKDMKSSIIKAARLARNVLCHNLDIPTTKEAFSLLTDAFKLSEIVSKLERK